MRKTPTLLFLLVACVLSFTEADAPFGGKWYRSTKDINLIVESDYTQWNLTDDHGEDINIVSQFSGQKVSQSGDKASFKMKWTSSGENSCPSNYWTSSDYNYQCEQLPEEYIEDCAHHSVNCLAGTGDFRIALLDSQGKKITDDGYDNSVFNDMLGYNFHVYPHVSKNAVEYHDDRSGSGHGAMVPCNFDFKGSGDDPFTNSRIEYDASIGCFQIPLNEETTFTLELERKSSTSMNMVMSMGNISRSYLHDWSDQVANEDYGYYGGGGDASYIPSNIDTIAICYPNERKYYYAKMKNN